MEKFQKQKRGQLVRCAIEIMSRNSIQLKEYSMGSVVRAARRTKTRRGRERELELELSRVEPERQRLGRQWVE